VEFGQEVRRRREAAGLTLEGLAERSSLTPNYIGGIEMGRRDPSLSTVLSLAQGLRLSPADLMGGLPGMSPSAIEAGLLFEGTRPDLQDAVLRLLRTVAFAVG
jgi:transcriptional regulator with XRE-family HTH domain